jgi:hypothetical protein
MSAQIRLVEVEAGLWPAKAIQIYTLFKKQNHRNLLKITMVFIFQLFCAFTHEIGA